MGSDLSLEKTYGDVQKQYFTAGSAWERRSAMMMMMT